MRPTVAWTGGSRPRRLLEIGPEERRLVREIFRYHCEVWQDHWKVKGEKGLFKTFWNHARYDAHATMREVK